MRPSSNAVRYQTLRLRPLVALLFAVALGACATRPDQVDVTVGIGFPEIQAANDYAALYVPYAMMATAAYALPNVLTANNCPDTVRLARRQAGDDDATSAFNNTVRGWVAALNRMQWDCRFGVTGSLPCPPGFGPDCNPVGGLEFHVWRRMQNGRCREVVIAFRGTDRGDRGDWISNFHWLYRLAPRFDQYDQVRVYMRRIVERIKRRHCTAENTLFVSTGHSLGGGLAQQAAYAAAAIRYVYAFDPSPVTGFFDISAILRERNVRGLGVDRAYEAGEILELPRILIENIFPPFPCNPRIRTVRFSLLAGSPLMRHSIAAMTEKLRAASRTAGADASRALALRAAADCIAPPLLELLAPPA